MMKRKRNSTPADLRVYDKEVVFPLSIATEHAGFFEETAFPGQLVFRFDNTHARVFSKTVELSWKTTSSGVLNSSGAVVAGQIANVDSTGALVSTSAPGSASDSAVSTGIAAGTAGLILRHLHSGIVEVESTNAANGWSSVRIPVWKTNQFALDCEGGVRVEWQMSCAAYDVGFSVEYVKDLKKCLYSRDEVNRSLHLKLTRKSAAAKEAEEKLKVLAREHAAATAENAKRLASSVDHLQQQADEKAAVQEENARLQRQLEQMRIQLAAAETTRDEQLAEARASHSAALEEVKAAAREQHLAALAEAKLEERKKARALALADQASSREAQEELLRAHQSQADAALAEVISAHEEATARAAEEAEARAARLAATIETQEQAAAKATEEAEAKVAALRKEREELLHRHQEQEELLREHRDQAAAVLADTTTSHKQAAAKAAKEAEAEVAALRKEREELLHAHQAQAEQAAARITEAEAEVAEMKASMEAAAAVKAETKETKEAPIVDVEVSAVEIVAGKALNGFGNDVAATTTTPSPQCTPQGTRCILVWVDDTHEDNVNLVGIACEQGIEVVLATQTRDALNFFKDNLKLLQTSLETRGCDVENGETRPAVAVRVITNMIREKDGGTAAGTEFAALLRAANVRVPIMIYSLQAVESAQAHIRSLGMEDVLATRKESVAWDFALFNNVAGLAPAVEVGGGGGRAGGGGGGVCGGGGNPLTLTGVFLAGSDTKKSKKYTPSPAAAAALRRQQEAIRAADELAAAAKKWEKELNQLGEMGFRDATLNIPALEALDGNVQGVVLQLLNGRAAP